MKHLTQPLVCRKHLGAAGLYSCFYQRYGPESTNIAKIKGTLSVDGTLQGPGGEGGELPKADLASQSML